MIAFKWSWMILSCFAAASGAFAVPTIVKKLSKQDDIYGEDSLEYRVSTSNYDEDVIDDDLEDLEGLEDDSESGDSISDGDDLSLIERQIRRGAGLAEEPLPVKESWEQIVGF